MADVKIIPDHTLVTLISSMQVAVADPRSLAGDYRIPLGLAAAKDVPVTGDAAADEVVLGADTRFPPIVDTTALVKGSVDDTKLWRVEVDSFTGGVTRVLTPADRDWSPTVYGEELTEVADAAGGRTKLGLAALAVKDVIDTQGEILPFNRNTKVGGQTLTLNEAEHLRVIYCDPTAGGTPGDIVITFDAQANFTQSFKCWIYVRDQAAGQRVILKAATGEVSRAVPISTSLDISIDDTNGVFIGLADEDNHAIASVTNVHPNFNSFIVTGHVRQNATDDLRFDTLIESGATSVTYTDVTLDDGATVTDADRAYEVVGTALVVRRLVLKHSVDPAASSVTVTIADSVTAGHHFFFLRDDAQTAAVTIQRQTNGTIDGAISQTIPEAGQHATVVVKTNPGTAPKMDWAGPSAQDTKLYGALDANGKVVSGNLAAQVTDADARTVADVDTGKTLIYTGTGHTWTFNAANLTAGAHGLIRHAGTGLLTVSTDGVEKFKGTEPIPVDASAVWEWDGTRLWLDVNV